MAQIRGKGEGTWKRRKNGLWEWQGTISGKRRSVYGPTQTAVRAELKRIR